MAETIAYDELPYELQLAVRSASELADCWDSVTPEQLAAVAYSLDQSVNHLAEQSGNVQAFHEAKRKLREAGKRKRFKERLLMPFIFGGRK